MTSVSIFVSATDENSAVDMVLKFQGLDARWVNIKTSSKKKNKNKNKNKKKL